MKLLWLEGAWKEYLEWLQKDKKTFKKINALIESIQSNGYRSIGKPEPLKGNYSGWWSVRINNKDRLVFKIEDDNIVILQCSNHYDDK